MKIILPKSNAKIEPDGGPLFYLAGPVLGGCDWQRDCCEEIGMHMLSFYAAIPCRYDVNHPLMAHIVPSWGSTFGRQTLWERHFLQKAATTGCIIFWLPTECKSKPRNDGKPYAMDTRGELGEWRGRMMSNRNIRLVIGADTDFPGLDQIQCNWNEALKTRFLIHPTLAETVKSAVEIVR